MESRPSIFEYLDYRAFLQDMFAFRKRMNRFFSYRFFSRESGLSSPNFLKLVMDGRRNMTSNSIAKFARGFGLSQKERDFFENLVFMNQAASHEQRNHYYLKMMRMKGLADVQRLEKAAYDYFSNWYCPVIREIACFGDGRLTAEEIAAALEPPITTREAEGALELLARLGLLKKDADGRWTQGAQAVSTGPAVRSLVVANFHREMLRLAAEAIERHPAARRDISAVTLGVRGDRMAEIKEKAAAFRKELLELAGGDEGADRVIQVNIQAFPLTREAVLENKP